MKAFSLILFLSMSGSLVLKAEPRTFTNKDGRELSAEIVSVSADWKTVTIRSNGQEFSLPPTDLSLEDQQFIKDWLTDRGITTPGKTEISEQKEEKQELLSDVDRYEEIISDTNSFALNLKLGDAIKSKIPVADRSIKIEISEIDSDGEGVLFQLGGVALGIYLELEDGILKFAKNDRKESASVKRRVTGGKFDAVGILDKDGLSLQVNDYKPETERTRVLHKSPLFGITTGYDRNSGRKYEGSVGKIRLTVD